MTVWLFCAGRPDGAIDTLRALPLDGWPPGVYELPGLPLRIVVLAELPETDDTLALRLMASGSVRDGAIRQLGQRFASVAEGHALLMLMNDAMVTATRGPPATENTMVKTPYSDAFVNKGRAEGRTEGRAEGRAEGRRAALLAVLTARTIAVDDTARATIDACIDTAVLDRWVVRAATATSLAGVFGSD